MRALDNAINNVCYCTSGSKSTGSFMTSLMLLKGNVHHHTTSPTTTPPLPSLTSAPQICSKPEHASKWTHSFLAWQSHKWMQPFCIARELGLCRKAADLAFGARLLCGTSRSGLAGHGTELAWRCCWHGTTSAPAHLHHGSLCTSKFCSSRVIHPLPALRQAFHDSSRKHKA